MKLDSTEAGSMWFAELLSGIRHALDTRTSTGVGPEDRKPSIRAAELLKTISPDTQYDWLDLSESDVEQLPSGISVRFRLNLENCRSLTRLPDGLQVGSLNINGCTSLRCLPEGLDATFLDMAGCASVESWPRTGSLSVGRLSMRDCPALRALPPWLGHISQLDVAGCLGLDHLPEDLEVSSWIDVADTGITRLPESLAGVGIRWRGVRVDERIAFRPGEITADEVLGESNAELRRVMLERMGYERFLEHANSEILDRDTDPGGERQLLRVPLVGDEPLVCVSVRCPSTGRRYLLRVPPETRTCREAVAWSAGFDDPDDYEPIVET